MSLLDILGLTSRGTGECIITIGGEEISEFYTNLQSTTVTLQRQDSSEAILNFIDLHNDEGQWPILLDDRFQPWKKLTLSVIFDGKESAFFSGYIREIHNDQADYGKAANITVHCQDQFIAMDRQTIHKNWDSQRDSLDIVDEIVGNYDITLDAPAPFAATANHQQNSTDYRFIRTIANNNGYEFYLRDSNQGSTSLYLGPPQTSSSAEGKDLLIRAGRHTNCLSFNSRFDGYQPDAISTATAPTEGTQSPQQDIRPELPVMGTRSTDSSDCGLNDFTWAMPAAHGNNQEAAQALALSQAEEQAFKLQATGRLDGTVYGQLLLPGTTVNVGGASANNGTWYVDKTTHQFSANGYFVDFELVRNASAGEEASSSHVLSGVL